MHMHTTTQVRSIAGNAGWEAPKVFVAGLVDKLETETAAAGDATRAAPLRFEEFVADLIEDREGKWWLTQVSALNGLRVAKGKTSESSSLLILSILSLALDVEGGGDKTAGIDRRGGFLIGVRWDVHVARGQRHCHIVRNLS